MLSCRYIVFVYVLFFGDLFFIGIFVFLFVGIDNIKVSGLFVRDLKDRVLFLELSKIGVSRIIIGSSYIKFLTS